MVRLRRILPLLLAILTLIPSVAFADDPRLDYHTIETPNFWVHYHSGTEALAWKVAVVAEEAHEILTPLLDWTPTHRTHVVVNDKVDSANGSATVFGRQQINVFGMAPESDSVLGFYDDWLRVLVYHEYVHILHLDTALGIPPLVNKVIGKQWVPNQTLPRWYVEGIATYFESAVTRGGRVDSSLFKMYLRAAALEGGFFDLGAATGLPVEWPSGTAAYLYGGFFLDYVFTKYGEKVGAEFNHRYGRRILPWALNSIVRDISGQTFDELWKEWAAQQSGAAMATRVAVRARGETQLRHITSRGGNSGTPRLRPGTQEIWFYEFDHERSPAYSSILSTGSNRERRFDVDAGAGPFAFSPDGQELIYTQSTTYQSSYRFLDLYARSLERNTVRRLTRGERARDPAVSPDGKLLAYTRNREGTMELVVRDFAHPSAPARVLLSGLDHDSHDAARWQQISTPAFSPDGTALALSWWRQDDGQRDLWVVDLQSGEPRRLTNDFAVDVDPTWADDGKIYFSSDRTGVFNIFALDPTTLAVSQVSDVVTGVFSPQLTERGGHLFCSVYGAHGYDIARFELPAAPTPAPASVIDALPPVDYPEIDTTQFQEKSYAPYRWLVPILVQPQLGVVTSGAGAGVAVQGFDPVGHHRYELSGGYTTGRELEDKSSNATFSYANRQLPVTLALQGAFRDSPRARGLFAESRNIPYVRRQMTGRLALTYPFRALKDTLSFGVSFEVDRLSFASEPVVHHDPADLEPSGPELGWFNELGFSLNYTNRESYPRSVTTANGWAAAVNFSLQDPVIGSDYRSFTFGYGLDFFIQNPIWPRHSLGLLLDGGLVFSDLSTARRYAVGGNSPQDIFTSVLLQRQRRTFVVRGFEPGATSGSQFQIVQAAYRFPILDLDRGFSTLPVFLRQLKGVVFMDNGAAFDGFLGDASLLTGFGGEILLESVFAYYLFGNLRLGYARGLGQQGINEFYALFGGGF